MERLPLFEKKIIKKISEQRLDTIIQALSAQTEREQNPGFMTGLAGQAILLYSYGRSFGISRCENLGFLALERALTMVNNGFSIPSFAAGIAGIRFSLKYLSLRGYISESDGSTLDELGPYLDKFAEQRFAIGDYDLLHGALGMYLHEQRYPQEDAEIAPNDLVIPAKAQPEAGTPSLTTNSAMGTPSLTTNAATGTPSLTTNAAMGTPSLTTILNNLAIVPSPGYRAWQARHPQTGTPEINLGLAHGIPSVLWMLSRQPQSYIRDNLLSCGVDYLLSCRMNDTSNGSLFPHRIMDGVPDQPGRLAWCYGDPGIGAALWQIGLSSNRPDWQADAIGILHKAASRREMEPNRVMDACICHGTAGLALIFYKMALLTGHEELLEAAEYWTHATLDHGQKSDGAAGYEFLTTGDRFVPSYSLLEGITGVGLTLLALLDADTMGWEQGLLL